MFDREKVLYEISMSIGNTLDIQLMCKEFLSTLSKKLSLTTTAIIEYNSTISVDDVIFSIPRRIKHNQDYINSFESINSSNFTNIKLLENKVRYIFELKGFGYIIMFSTNEIEPLIIKSLEPLFKKVVVALISCQDHTKLKESLIEAKEAGEAKMQFLATMSHEIRTPINGISGFVQILQRTKLDAKQEKYLKIVQSSIKTLEDVINDILDFSKLESKKVELDFIEINPNRELYTSLLIYEPKAKEKNITFTIDIDNKIADGLIMSFQHIKQVMSNLISNAIKFTSNNGEINISLRVIDESAYKQTIHFEVGDTGIGIPKEKQKNIFEPFTQADSSTTRNYGGTGLGLSICLSLIDLMGSKLHLQSEQDKGSRFYFDLELEKTNTTETIDELEKANLLNESKLNILVAEDNETNQLLMETILLEYDISFKIVDNGKKVIDIIKEVNDFDLILMDINMPVMGGVEATKILREELKSDIPIVALTANVLSEDIKKYLSIGMNYHLAKPLDFNELNSLLEKFQNQNQK